MREGQQWRARLGSGQYTSPAAAPPSHHGPCPKSATTNVPSRTGTRTADTGSGRPRAASDASGAGPGAAVRDPAFTLQRCVRACACA